jgi:type IV pilus assembly protein PilA
VKHLSNLNCGRYAIPGLALGALLLCGIRDCAAQNKSVETPGKVEQTPGARTVSEWLPEIGRIMQRLQREVNFPPERNQSQLLPLMPETTTAYAAFGNYAEVIRQVLKIFREERETSPLLRDWWQRTQAPKDGENPEIAAEKFAQLEDFLGDEVVVSARLEEKKPGVFAAAEVRKPGLDAFLRKLMADYGAKRKPGVLIFNPQELAAAKDGGRGKELLVLVHPKYVVASEDLSALRSFQARLENSEINFAGTPFAQRLAQEYDHGTTILAGADLQRMLKHLPELTAAKKGTLEESGFANAKFAIWGHRIVEGQTISRGELSFTEPRRGPAAWLAKPQPLTTLDFVSPKAMMAATIVLTKPEKIFDDARELASGSPSNPFVSLAQFEKLLRLSLRDDVLRNLQGELTLELDDFAPPKPMWRAILKVNDAAHLQTAFDALLAATQLGAEHSDAAGAAITKVRIPAQGGANEIAYAFADGHLIVGPSPDSVAAALELHKSGESLAKSKSLQAALPPGHSTEASALFYQDAVAMYALEMQRLMPGASDAAAKLAGQAPPSVLCLYGEESAIRSASKSSALDAGVILVVAAVAIPNLLRSRVAANEAGAVGSLRTIYTAQVTYGVAYPKRGYAPSLGKLGPNPADAKTPTPEHADLIDESLASENCTADGWCTKSGYRFNLKGICMRNSCSGYVVTAAPVSSNTGTRSFCSTSDGIIRMQVVGSPLTAPLTVAECRTWEPVR